MILFYKQDWSREMFHHFKVIKHVANLKEEKSTLILGLHTCHAGLPTTGLD